MHPKSSDCERVLWACCARENILVNLGNVVNLGKKALNSLNSLTSLTFLIGVEQR